MDRVVFVMCASAVLAVAAVWGGRADAFHLISGSVLVAAAGGGAYAIRRLRSADAADAADAGSDTGRGANSTGSPLRPAFFGVLTGLGLLLPLAAWYRLLESSPVIYAGYYDRDRADFERRLSAVEQAGDFGRAAGFIEDRLKRRLSAGWRRQLGGRLYDDLVAAGRQRPGAERLAYFAKARGVAAEFGLNDALAATLAENASVEADLAARLDSLRADRRFSDVVDILRTEMRRAPDSRPVAVSLYEAYLHWAGATADVAEKRRLYSEANGIAVAHGIEPDAAATAIRLIDASAADRSSREKAAASLRDQTMGVVRRELQAAGSLRLRKSVLEGLAPLGYLNEDVRQDLRDVEARLAELQRLETSADELRRRGAYEELIAVLAPVVKAGNRRDWRQPLDEWLSEALLAWSEAADSLDAKRERVGRALQTCRECGLSDAALASHVRLVDAAAAERQRLTAVVDQMRTRGAFGDLAAYLRVKTAECERSQWAAPYHDWLYEALLDGGTAEGDPSKRVTVLEEAVLVAERYGLDGQAARRRLAVAKAELEAFASAERRRLEPAALPEGATAGVVGSSLDLFPPAVVFELWVEGNDGEPVTTLTSKDFAVTIGGQEWQVAAAPFTRDQELEHVVLAIDVSSSTAPSLGSLKEAAREFLSGLEGENVDVKLILFGSTVDQSRPWTRDLKGVGRELEAVSPAGKTALFRAIMTGAAGLRGLPGRKRLVLFTDGRDTVGGVTHDEVVRACQAADVAVSAIGLQTMELDTATLRSVAESTGGNYAQAADVAELEDRFRRAARGIPRQRYRLVATGSEASADPGEPQDFSVTIGGDHSVTIKETVSARPVTQAAAP